MAIAMARRVASQLFIKHVDRRSGFWQGKVCQRSESGMIIDPVTLQADSTIQEALRLMEQFKIGGIPVVDTKNKLVGILTNRDLRFEVSRSRPVREIMTSENLITAPVGTTLDKAKAILQKFKIEKLPVVKKNGT